MKVRPLGSRMYVEKVRREKTDGGILIPETFDHRHRASLKMGAVRDHFEAKVLAVGPEVRDVGPGDLILVYTFADKGALWTGEDGGEKDRLFIRYPDDVMVAIERDPYRAVGIS